MGKRCPVCGNEVEGNNRFCEKCGNSVDMEAEVSGTEALGRNFLQSMSVKMGVFSAVIALLGFLFKKVDPTIGTTVFAVAAPMFIISIVIIIIIIIFNY